MGKKTLEELVFHDDFMFAAVMMDAENCRCFLERVLEIAKELHDGSVFLVKKDSLEKRSRYYHNQMDVEMLEKGKGYSELPDAYVIFVCNFDPLGEKKCRYTIRKYCEETGKTFADGVCTVFLNTKGENRDEVPKELAALLDFVKADLVCYQPIACLICSVRCRIRSIRNNYLRNLEFSSKTNRFMRFASCVNFGKSLAHISMSRFA